MYWQKYPKKVQIPLNYPKYTEKIKMNENPEFKMFLVNQIARFLNQLYL